MEETERLERCLDQFEYYNTWFAGNEDVNWVKHFFVETLYFNFSCLNFLASM